MSQLVEDIASQFAHHFAQSVEVGCPADGQLRGFGQGMTLGDSGKGGSFGVFLLCVLYKAGIKDILMILKIEDHFLEQGSCLCQEFVCCLELVSMCGAYAV